MFLNSSDKKRKALRNRLIWIFQRDAIEGQLDCLVRSILNNSKKGGYLR